MRVLNDALPLKLQPYPIISFGAVGIVSNVNDVIAVKYLREDADDPTAEQLFQAEQDAYKQLEERAIHKQYLLRCFLCTDKASFLEFVPGETLWQRHRYRQEQDPDTSIVLRVTQHDPQELITAWIYHVTQAVLALEEIGLVHGDLTDNNILISDQDRLVLVDFDRSAKIGTSSDGGGGVPFARHYAEEDAGYPYGVYGSQTEQFALGSIFYCMSRGFQPYEDTHSAQQGPETVDLMREKKFPLLTDSKIDELIRACWHGEFKELGDVASRISECFPLPSAQTSVITQEEFLQRSEECRALVADGLLQK